MIFYADIKDTIIDGYYCKDLHESIPTTAIPINEELHIHLLKENKILVDINNLTKVAFTLEEDQCYTIEHKDFFRKQVQVKILKSEEQTKIENLEEKIKKLENLILTKL